MNEETKTPEPLAAILKEMRGNEFDDPHLDADGIIGARRLARDWAERIEAAAERERAEWSRQLRNEIQINNALATVRPQLHSVGDVMAEAAKERAHEIELAKLRAPGNAAALREALEGIEDDCRVLDRKDMWEEEGECYYDALRDIREKVSAALAAPARNCDRFKDGPDALFAYKDTLRDGEEVRVPWLLDWLFEPAKEGGDHA